MTQLLVGQVFADMGGLLLLPVGLLAIACWIWMIVDCAKHESGEASKIVWLLILVLVGIVGTPFYFFFRHMPRRKLERYRTKSAIYQPWPKNVPLAKSRH